MPSGSSRSRWTTSVHGDAFGPRDQLAQGRIPDVGVVVPAPRPHPLHRRGRHQRRPVAAGGALPPGAVGLGLQPGGMRQQLRDRRAPERRAGYVVLEPVVEVEPTGVAQPHDAHRHERLGDRADPVLRVGVGGNPVGAAVERAARVGPDQLAAADDPRGHRRQPDLPLLDGEPGREVARGRRVQRRHAVRPCGPTPERRPSTRWTEPPRSSSPSSSWPSTWSSSLPPACVSSGPWPASPRGARTRARE